MYRVHQTICVAHSSDVDGIVSAALVKCATKAEVMLASYGNFIDTLKSISNASDVYICDLGLSPGTIRLFSDEVNRIKRFAKVTYIDHHRKVKGPFSYRSSSSLRVVHSLRDCAAALTYNYFRGIVPKEASILAAYAALTDYLEDGPIASKILGLYDRIHLYYEVSILAYAIEELEDKPQILRHLIEELSKLRYPHEIEGLVKYASQHAHRFTEFMVRVRKEAMVGKSFAYIDASGFPKGTAANLVRCLLEVPVGVAYSVKSGSDFVELSLRASSDYKRDLGAIVQDLAWRFGGFGGGHAKASGARIPKESLSGFLKALDDII